MDWSGICLFTQKSRRKIQSETLDRSPDSLTDFDVWSVAWLYDLIWADVNFKKGTSTERFKMATILQTSDLIDTVFSKATKQNTNLKDNTCCHGVVGVCVRGVNHFYLPLRWCHFSEKNQWRTSLPFNHFILTVLSQKWFTDGSLNRNESTVRGRWMLHTTQCTCCRKRYK